MAAAQSGFLRTDRTITRIVEALDRASATRALLDEVVAEVRLPVSDGRLMELLEDHVREAVLHLPEDFRQAVILADLEDRSYKEIAEIMDCPLGTVMSRLFRGRKLLREALGDYARSQGIVKSGE